VLYIFSSFVNDVGSVDCKRMDSTLKFAAIQKWTSVSNHFIVNVLQYYHSFRSKMYTLQTRVLLFVII
jgi:hypothetical protein